MTDFGHYTTMHGLMGVVRDQALWATNIRYLNDEQDYLHALALLEQLKPRIASLVGDKSNRGSSEFLSLAYGEIDNFNCEVGHNLYTVSFSTETDLLSQWRGYCPNNNGYCVIFNAKAIFRDLSKYSIAARFVRCVYKDTKKARLIIDTFVREWNEYCKADDASKRELIVSDLAGEVLRIASYSKHSSFEEENEYRIVLDPAMQMIDQEILFREGKYSVIPYLKIPAPRRYIRKIIVGPTVNQA